MPVVVIPVFNAPDETIACLESVVRHTPANVRLLIIDDHGPDRRFFDHLDRVRPSIAHTIDVVRPDKNLGFVGACNLAFSLTTPHDVILVNSDVIVGPEWYERIVDAARSSSDIATVSVFTNNGTILSLPHRNSPCPDIVGGWTVEQAAERIAAISERVRPIIPTAVGHCFLVKRLALNLVGGFDVAFGTGYGEEVDFSQRCIRMGLRHIVADDVFVFHKGSSSFTAGARPQQIAHEAIVNARYPWYSGSVQRAASDSYSPLATAINRASLQLRSPSIAFDGHSLAWNWTGTQQITIGFIEGFARLNPDRRFSVIIPENVPSEVLTRLHLNANIDLDIVPDLGKDRSFRFDLVVRPYQVNSVEELRWMRRISNRCVVAHLDFIAYNNPEYFESDHDWLSHRELTSLVLSAVDGVAWISEYARQDAIRLGLFRETVAHRVTYNGVELLSDSDTKARPKNLPVSNSRLLTVLGVGFRHKNRLFALRILRTLIERGEDVQLVFAGPTPRHGSSGTEEEAFLSEYPELRQHFRDLGAVSNAERNWLLANSAAVLYPTLSEGFGLIPFEAAAFQTPVLSSRMGSLDEVLPGGLPTFGDFDPVASAEVVLSLISSEDSANQPIDSIRRRATTFTWARSIESMMELIEEVLDRPKNRCEGVWAEAPVPAQTFSPEFARQSQEEARRSNTYRLLASNRVGRLAIGRPGSRRRRIAKAVYRMVRH